MTASAAEERPLSLLGFARQVIDAFEAARIDYLLGGALAVAAWAEPRSTQDIDLVINLPLEQIQILSTELEKREILIPADLMLDLLREERGDEALVGYHTRWGHKVEMFLLRPGDELRAAAFQRGRRIDLGQPLGVINLHSPEDLILYKLIFYSISQQTKHTRDITALLLALRGELDYEYLSKWVGRKGLNAIWGYMQSQLDEQDRKTGQ